MYFGRVWTRQGDVINLLEDTSFRNFLGERPHSVKDSELHLVSKNTMSFCLDGLRGRAYRENE